MTRTGRPFTRGLAALLAMVMLRVSVAGAAEPGPGTLALLEPSIQQPGMRAVWDGLHREIAADPLLLLKPEEEVSRALEQWSRAADLVQGSWRTADRVAGERVQDLLEEARDAYYGFHYSRARDVLDQAVEVLSTPGGSGMRADLLFEAALLRGMVARAQGQSGYEEDFRAAAALSPEKDLDARRYSPQTIAVYQRVRHDLLAAGKVPLHVEGTPRQAILTIDGISLGPVSSLQGLEILPGRHFLETSMAGYEPWNLTLQAGRFEPGSIRFVMEPSGPPGDPHPFFVEKIRSGDREYLALLAEKLKVDYLLIPEAEQGRLGAWLLDREGRSVGHFLLWEEGESPDAALERVSAALRPVRQEFGSSQVVPGPLMNMPLFPEDRAAMAGTGTRTFWSRYGPAITLLAILAVAAGSRSGGGGTRLEVTW